MAYCRWSEDSDLYVYPGESGFVCMECPLDGRTKGDFSCPAPQEMLAHMHAHIEAGHKVPATATARLSDEIAHGIDATNLEELIAYCQTKADES